MTGFYLPSARQELSEESVWRWYNNILEEVESSFLRQGDRDYLSAYYDVAGLLRPWRRRFFRHHYSRAFADAARALLGDGEAASILDLGGGAGTQAIFLALMGASVVVLDIDRTALDVLERRRDFYGGQADRQLDISAICADALHFDYESIAPIDGVYSLFAFNMMQPSRQLLARICPAVSSGGRFVVQDGNRLSWVSKVLPWRRRRVLSPIELSSELRDRRFDVVSHSGGPVFPPLAWTLCPAAILRPLDEWLARTWTMPVSHQIVAKKCQ